MPTPSPSCWALKRRWERNDCSNSLYNYSIGLHVFFNLGLANVQESMAAFCEKEEEMSWLYTNRKRGVEMPEPAKQDEWRVEIHYREGDHLIELYTGHWHDTNPVIMLSHTDIKEKLFNQIVHEHNVMVKVRKIAQEIRSHLPEVFVHSVKCSMLTEYQSYKCDPDCVYVKWDALLNTLAEDA